jgi:hypothetical protein
VFIDCNGEVAYIVGFALIGMSTQVGNFFAIKTPLLFDPLPIITPLMSIFSLLIYPKKLYCDFSSSPFSIYPVITF